MDLPALWLQLFDFFFSDNINQMSILFYFIPVSAFWDGDF